jgi:hypothetical protein
MGEEQFNSTLPFHSLYLNTENALARADHGGRRAPS